MNRTSFRYSCLFTSALFLGMVLLPQANSPAALGQDAPPEECIFSSDAPLTVTLEAGQGATISFDENCEPIIEIYPSSGPEDEGSTEGYETHEVGVGTKAEPSNSLDGTMDESSSSLDGEDCCEIQNHFDGWAVYNGSSRVHDPAHWDLTHQRAFFRWYFELGYTNVGRSFANSGVYTKWLQDGWHETDGPHAYWYPFNASSMDAEAYTSFAWIGGAYPIEHYVHLYNINYWGTCQGTFIWTGSICGICHTHVNVYIT